MCRINHNVDDKDVTDDVDDDDWVDNDRDTDDE